MIKLTWGNLRNSEFMQSLGKIYGQAMGFDVGMKLALLGREIKKQQKLCDETHLGILKKYGTEDEKKPGFYQIKEEYRKEYAAEMEKLDAHDFSVKINRVDASKLAETVQFSPQDLMLLEPVFAPFDETAEPVLKAVPEQPQPTQPTSH
jgi:hypothetical protein